MSTDQFLTKDERDALMEVVSKKSRSRINNAGAYHDDAQPYDLSSQDYPINSLLPVLETIHERFAHRLRISLFELLRRDLMVTVGSTEKSSYTDLTTSLSVPCSVNVIGMVPLRGPALLIFDQELIFMVVDTFFGGTGRSYKPSGSRTFTVTENRFIQRLLDLSFRCLEDAWEPFTALKCSRQNAESKPQFITALNPNETLTLSSVHISRDSISGTIHLAMPYSILEPIRKTLIESMNKEHPNPNPRLTERLMDGIRDSQVEPHCYLGSLELSLSELLELKVGDVIPVDIPQFATLQVENVPIYRGTYGVAQGWRAFRVERALETPGTWTLPSGAADFAPFEAQQESSY